ncbi:hypothetical protein BS78_03G007300 [Paspalum vaginatum]|nr:hypothetical protein BS78_03G007300 [Paspalum vaginatum]
MKHAASESDVTTQSATATATSSSSPKRPAYYVQSPSSTARATPVYSSISSPLESPSRPSGSSGGRHSRVSSATRFSGALLRSSSLGGGRRRLVQLASASKQPQPQQGWWREVGAIDEEEGAYGGGEEREPEEEEQQQQQQLPTRCCVVAFWLSVLVLAFAVVCLVVWGAARRDRPSVAVKRLTVHRFYAGQGTDRTGVPTKLVTLNCSLEINVHNPSTTFGIHVSSSSIRITYSEIAIANGQLVRFYQPRASRRVASVILHGEKTPLYGAGAALAPAADGGGVPLTLELAVRTRGYVLGKLVTVTHAQRVKCPVAVDPGSSKAVSFSRRACTSSYR